MCDEGILIRIDNVTFIPIGLQLQKWENKYSQITLNVRKPLMLERYAEEKEAVL